MSAGNFFPTLVLNRNAFVWGVQKSEYEAISVLEEAMTSDAALLLVQPDPGSALKNNPSGLLLQSLLSPGRELRIFSAILVIMASMAKEWDE